MQGGAIVAILMVTLAGMAISTQGGINVALARSIGGPVAAAAASFVVGAVLLLALTLTTQGLAPVRALATVPGWQLAGGVLGAWYVFSVTFSLPQLGVLTTAAALIFGQIAAALLIDAIGAFGLAVQPITWNRLLAAALVGAGLYLSRF